MLKAILIASLPLVAIYLWHRLVYYRRKQYADWPQLEPSLAMGHLRAMGRRIMSSPSDIHVDHVLANIAKDLGNPPLYMMDLRPASYCMAVVCSHEVAEQISKSSKPFPYSVTKSPTSRMLSQLLGPASIVIAEGEVWKTLRKRFNPGFSHQHLMTLLPCILDKTEQFLANLDRYAASGQDFRLEELCTNLTFDIIGAVTMDTDLKAQMGEEQQSELVSLFRALVSSYRIKRGRRWAFLDLRVYLTRWSISRRLDSLLQDIVREKFTELKHQTDKDSSSRSVLSLSLKEASEATPALVAQTSDQLKSFLFAGHDTTSTLLQWAFYELSRTPRAMQALRAEHDAVLGLDPSPDVVRKKFLSPTSTTTIAGDELLRRLPYTAAVIKEILRLYPPAGTARYSSPGTGFTVRLPDGKNLCLDGVMLYNCHSIIQRDEAVYGPTKDAFMPERWLSAGDDGSSSVENNGVSAWRPFERGPRNCIGQELATIEARVILACVARRYEWEKVGLGEFSRNAAGELLVQPDGRYAVESEVYNVCCLLYFIHVMSTKRK
ncbi:hypothetical protein ASPZODRAFT_145000 [Penicilliopsis zonata CBS 506.65]|uniref:Uncharacterized protein n=1 Tax=Penicilliopsis zonata CBS 506.65 TaxID=1073090 RepID=A0A1L9SBA5_9EURO|nr:hypothetical protein ASPZODRAFT_145000 [Penicilliopsis zonata CBS 506.65]OJJ44441.1 hypothetical protein ASPZODRAFT_145000 [Penicilliopsis zonata CBS 506.65]